MYRYKVLTEKKTSLGGRFDAEALEQRLNAHAADGWRLAEGVNVMNMKLTGGQLLFVLERSAPSAE